MDSVCVPNLEFVHSEQVGFLEGALQEMHVRLPLLSSKLLTQGTRQLELAFCPTVKGYSRMMAGAIERCLTSCLLSEGRCRKARVARSRSEATKGTRVREIAVQRQVASQGWEIKDECLRAW